MPVFDDPAFDHHEQIVFCHDPQSGLRAIIALHNTNRGPALGGARMWNYADSAAALTDVLRLSRGMTYKSALAGLPFGGGKAVILGDPKHDKSPDLFHALGRYVDSLGGRYTVAEDVGIDVADIEQVAHETAHVAGVPAGGSGDPSPATAYGVFVGIRAAIKHRLGADRIAGDKLTGISVAIQGAGHVGYELARHLTGAGADVQIADVDPARVKRAQDDLGATPIATDHFLEAEVDVLAPCALGGLLDDTTIPKLRTSIVAGAANNQLAETRHGEMLRERGILYAPDYVINAGGIINISYEGASYDRARAFSHVALIHDTLLAIFQRAEAAGIPTSQAADRLAEERFTHPNPDPAQAA
ncbi:Glu/Leu/Phe/Val dehydrogenase dimerization domain-containing protein [Rhodovibrio salinarum]|uniref:Glu/Leu/Phe/Val dehydrogenase n=1 Tax=Rhodovibrio salinarum TaxID=1087 RepID=A0A934QFU2_9PROT|nr:Glu/Leu/Phe/Val dehydrogenase dimerization domain-containing protein [Rhodovibrio salinarum]MBK1695715.1 Glu/Leu/Phe/Val dehydrogenase [Rhodovibrio salinarum]